ncbi:MAG: fibronectin type III domain-containing protein, partial [Elusimicrobiota bacterium]
MQGRGPTRTTGARPAKLGGLAAVLLAALLLRGLWAGTFTSANYEVSPGKENAGGKDQVTSSSFETNTSAGEAIVERMSSANYEVGPGLMRLIAVPGTVTDLAGSGLSTGTIRLSWTAPGQDGAFGQLQAGSSYYIQYGQNAVPSSWGFDSAQVTRSTSGVENGAVVSHDAGGLGANSTYYFRIWHRDPGGAMSHLSDETTTHTLAKLVTGVQVYRVFNTSATVNWVPRPGAPVAESARGYRLDASTAADFSGELLSSSTLNVALSTLTVAGLAPSATFYFRVGTLNHAWVPNFSVDGSTVTGTAVDIPPQDFQVAGVFLSSAALAWSQVNSEGYAAEASTAADFTGEVSFSSTTNGQKLTLSVAGLHPNTTYYLRAGAIWAGATYYAQVSTRSTLAKTVTILVDSFPAVFESSATAAWAALPLSPPAASSDSARGYRLEASSTNFIGGGVVRSSSSPNVSLSTLTVFSPALSPNTTYYFRAGSLNHEGQPNYVSLGSTPTLASLPSGAGIAAVHVGSVTVSWTPPASARGYQLEASTAADFTGEVKLSSTTSGSATGLTVRELSSNTTYYLRAGSFNHARVLNRTGVFASTATLADRVTGLSFSAVHESSAALSWTTVPSRGYEIRASSTGFDGSGTVHSSVTANGSLGSLAVLSPPLDANTTYFFRVGSINHNGARNFEAAGSTSTLAKAPEVLPQSFLDVFETSATANWAARPLSPLSETAEGYRLEASSTGFDGTGVVASTETRGVLLSTLTVLSPALDRNTTYYFRAASLNHNGVGGAYAALGSISTLARAPESAAAPFLQVHPASATVAWAALPQSPLSESSEGYELQASTAPDFTGTVVSSATADVLVSTLTVGAGAAQLERNTTYYFRVAALNHNSVSGPFLAVGSTATRYSPPEPGVPPVTAVSSVSVTAQWTSGAPANPAGTVYALRASTASDFTGTVFSSQTLSLTDTVSGLAPNTTYYLEVRVTNHNGVRAFGSLGSTATLAAQPAQLAVTFLEVFESSVTAAWVSGNAVGYRLEASTASDFTGVITSSETASVSVSTLTVFESPALDRNTTYYFRVAGFNHAGRIGAFTALGSTSTLARAPGTLATAFLDVFESSVTAAWAANPVSPLSETSEGYVLEASPTADFSGTVVSSRTADVLVSTLSALSPALAANTTHYFRAASLNHNGVPGPYAALGSTATLTATLADAAASAVYRTSITVSWTPLASAQGYELRASSTDFGAVSPGGVVISSATDNPSLGTLTVLSPALEPNTTYYLRAGGVNHNGVINFGSAGARSTLANLTQNHQFNQVNQSSVTVTWIPLPTAAVAGSSSTSEGYVVQASTSPNFGGTIVSSSTPNVGLSTLSVVGLFVNTTYYFRVGSLNWESVGNYAFVGSTVRFVTPPDRAWKVQAYSGELLALTLDVDIDPVYDLDRAFIVVPSGQMSAGVGNIDNNMDPTEVLVRASFVSASKVRLTRGVVTNGSLYSFFVVENPSGGEIYVKSGSNGFVDNTDADLDINVGAGISDYTKTAVFVSVESNNGTRDHYNQAHVRARMTSNTNLELRRTAGGSIATVNWFVVEFIGPDWTVQSGQTLFGANPTNQAITAVADTNKTWVYMNWSAAAPFSDDVSAKVELTAAANIAFSRDGVTTNDITANWFVMENPLIDVQRGGATSAAAVYTVNQTISQVDTTLAFPVTFNDSAEGGDKFPRGYWRATIPNPTTLTWDRSYAGRAAVFTWQVVHLSSNVAPGPVTNLSALVDEKLGEVRLSWTAPGDDRYAGILGQGCEFRIQHTTDAVGAATDVFWSTASAQIKISTFNVSPGTVQEWEVGSLWSNSTHFFRIFTTDEAGNVSLLSNGATVATLANPTDGHQFAAVNVTTVTVNWTPLPTAAQEGSSNTAEGYVVEASSTDFGAFLPGGVLYSSQTRNVSLSTLTAPGAVPELDPNTTYYWHVASLNWADARTYVAIGSTSTLAVEPTALAETFLDVSQSSVTVAWAARPESPPAASSETASGYLLQASTAADFTGVLISSETADLSVSTLTVLSPALDPNTTYYYRAGTLNHNHAPNFIHFGGTATLTLPPTALAQEATFLEVFETSVTVAWAAFPPAPSSASALGYRVEASSTDFDGTGVIVSSETDSVSLSTLTLSSPALDRNTTYYFRVTAFNHNHSVSRYTALGSTSTLAQAPTALAATFLGVFRTSATVAWTALPESPPAVLSETSEGYLLQASTAPDFTGIIVSSRTLEVAASTLTVSSPGLDSNTTYYFRAGSLNHNLAPRFTFLGSTATIANAPTALAQADTFQAVYESSITVAWAAHPVSPLSLSAEGYRVEASSTDFDGTGVVISSQTDNVLASTLTALSPSLDANTTYYFRVAAFNHNGVLSEYTTLFATSTLAAAPTALAQADAFLGVFETSATVAWAAVPASPQAASAEGYRLEASSTNFDGSGVVVSSKTADVLRSTLTVLSPALDRNTTYYFRVAAINHNGVPGSYAGLYSTSTKARPPTGPAFFAVFETSVTVRWDPLPQAPLSESAEGYLLQASLSPDFSGAVISSRTAAVTASTLTVLSPALAPNTTYYFRAASLNHNGVRSFTVVLATSTLALPPVANSPAATFLGVFGTSVTATWQARPGGPLSQTCEGYRLEASSTGFSGGTAHSARSSTYLGNTLTVLSPALDRNTTYYFRAASLNHNATPGNYTSLYATSTLVGTVQALPAADSFLVVGTTYVTVAWVAKPLSPRSESSEGYRLQASTAANFTGTVVSSRTLNVTLSTLTVSAPPLQEDTTYYFRVAALNANGIPGPYTALGSTVTLISGPQPLPTTFLGVFESSATVAWAATGANGYRLDASTAPDFSGVVVSSQTSAASVSTLTVVSPALDANTTHYFRVAAFNSQQVLGPYTQLGSTSTLARAPEALAASFVEVFESSATAAWAARPAGPLAESAEGYRLEASTAADFSGTVISSSTLDFLASTLTAVSPALSADTTYYFRAASLNHNGVWGAFASLGSTSTLTERPVGPAPLETFLSSMTAQWTAVTSQGYELQASASPDFSGTVYVSSTASGGATSLATPVSLAANTTYYLRVGGINHNGVRNFESAGSTSSLAQAPTAPSFQAVYYTSVTVQWTQAVCEGYELQASTGPDFTGVIESSATADAAVTALTATDIQSGTTWYFRVGSLNHNRVPHFVYAGSTFTLVAPLYWTGAGGDGNWYTESNWSPPQVPMKSNVVTIDVAANVRVDASSPAISFSSMTLGRSDGASEVSLTLSTGIAFGLSILVNGNAGLTSDTTAELRVSGNVTLMSGSSMTHTANVAASTGAWLSWNTSGVFDVKAGATVTVLGRGMPGGGAGAPGAGTGGGTGTAAADSGGGGGGYGGAGGTGDGASPGFGGSAYGSQTAPVDVGSGGGGSGGAGGSGGGYLRIAAQTIQLNGLLDARGSAGQSAAAGGGGGGSGGTIRISAVTVTGAGALRADGGSGQGGAGSEYGGGGGGGRIAVSASGSCSLDASESTADGGTSGGSGAAGSAGTTYSPNLTAAAGFTGVVQSSSAVSWRWTAGTGVLRYRVFAATGGAISGDLSSTTTEFLKTGLLPNTTYGAYVRDYGCAHLLDSLVAVSTTLAKPVQNIRVGAVFVTSATLNWNALAAAPQADSSAGYRLEASTAPDFSGTVLSSQTSNVALSTLTVANLGVNTTYYFRAGGLNLGGAPNYVVGPATATLLSTPQPGTPVFPVVSSRTITAQWTAGPEGNPAGTLYTLRASTASDFTGAVLSSQTVGFSGAASTLTPNSTYYFEVRATNRNGVVAYASLGSTATLTADVGSSQATQVFLSSVTVSWTPVTAQGYALQASTASDFTGTIHSSVTANGGLGSLATPATLTSNTTYYLRVGGVNHNGARNFVIIPATATLAPLVSAPDFQAVFFTSVTVNWTVPSPEPSGYRVEASTAADFSGGINSSATVVGSSDFLTVNTLNSGTTYYFRVASLNHASLPHYLAAGSTVTFAAPKTWVGAAGDNDWNTASNWNPLGVPTAGESVTINLSTTVFSQLIAISFSSLTLGSPDGSAAASLTLGAQIEAGQNIAIFRNAGLTIDTDLPVSVANDITMYAGSSMTHTANPALSTSSVLNLSVGGTFDIQDGATLTVKAKGMPGGASNGGPGVGLGGGSGIATNEKAGGGGGHAGGGGAGDNSGASGGGTYGSRTDPADVGSGGGGGGASSGGQGGAGGGLILISGDTILLDGLMDASGGDGGSAAQGGGGGGSGGSINLSAAAISGSGQLRADGGAGLGGGGSEYGGGGGGGRIRVNAAGTCALPNSAASVEGGASGGTGIAGFAGTAFADSLAAPTSLTGVVQSSTSVEWQWNAGAGAGDYQVRASTGGAFSGALSTTTFAFIHSGLEPNTEYSAFMRARGCASQDDSDVAVSTTLAKPVAGAQISEVFAGSATLNWPAFAVSPSSESAAGYRLEASTASDFSGDIASSQTLIVALSTLTVSGLDANTTYFFRIASLNLASASNFTDAGSTSTLVSASPATLPETFLEVFSSSATAAWAALPQAPRAQSAEGYVLQASTAADFTGTIHSSGTASVLVSTLTVLSPALSDNTAYYFRVAGLNANGLPGPYAALGSTATLIAGAPTALAAADTFLGVFESSATIAWAAGGLNGYRLESSTAPDFSGVVVSSETTDALVSTLTVLSPALDANTTHYFRAAFLNLGGVPGPYAQLGSTSTLAPAPEALAASFTEVFESSATAAWAARPATPLSESAEGYRLEASTAADFSGTVISSETLGVLVSTLTALAPALDADTTYYFRAASLNHNGVWGAFTSLGSTSSLTARPVGPAPSETFLSSMTVQWTAVTSQGYELQASTSEDFSGTVYVSSTASGGATTLDTPVTLNANTTYYLRVGGVNHNGARNFESAGSTSTLAQAPASPAFEVVYFTSVTVNWAQAVSEGYDLQASTVPDFTGVITSSATADVAVTTLTVTEIQSGATWYFRVGSLNHNGVPHFTSAGSTFTLVAPLYWTGSGGDGNWYTTSNWSPPQVPNKAHAVTINAAANVHVDVSSPAISFSSMTLGRPDGAAAVSLTLSTGIAFGLAIVVNDNAGLTSDTTTEMSVSGNVTLLSGSSMTHTANLALSTSSSLSWDIGGTFDIQAGATVTVVGRGMPGGVAGASGVGTGGGSGTVTADSGGGGGGYGGAGGTGDGASPGAGGSAYGSQTAPADVGSGGGGGPGASGGAGGGSIRIAAQTVHLNGLLDARGSAGQSAAAGGGGGGSGGTIRLSAVTVTGAGALRAGGGSGQGGGGSEYGGGGGGGRIAVSAAGTCSLDAPESTAGGGSSGGSGATGTDGTTYSPNLTAATGFTGVVQSSTAVAWRWTAGTGMFRNRVFSSTGGAISGELSSTTTEFLRTGLLPNTTYGAYVRDYGCGHSLDSLVAVSTTLARPLENVQVVGVQDTTVTLNWSALPAAPQADSSAGYRVEASTAPDFSGTVLSSQTVNVALSTLSVSGLGRNTTYYFRAASLNLGSVANFVAGGSTATLSRSPAAIAPSFTGVFETSATLRWAALPAAPRTETAEGYVLEASTASDFTGTVVSSRTLSVSLSTLSALSPALDRNTTYYFRVASLNWSKAPSAYTSLGSTSTLARSPQALANAFLTVHPASATAAWAALPGAPLAESSEGYELQASTAPDFTGTVISSATADVLVSTLTARDPALDRNTTYYFRVAALNHNAVPGPFLALGSTATLLSTPEAGVPAISAVSSKTVTGQWTSGTPANPSGTLYALRASTASDFTGAVLSSGTLNVSGTVVALTPDTTYYLEVRAANHNGVAAFVGLGSSSTWTADVTAPAAAVVYVSSLTAGWGVVSAQGYELQASTASNFTGTIHFSSTTNGGASALTLNGLTANTTYYLRAGGVNHNGARNFVVAPATPTLAQRVTSPAVAQVYYTSVTVSWVGPSPDPAGYRVDASTAPDFTGTIKSSATPNGAAVGLTVTALTSDTTYYLRVGSLNHARVPNYEFVAATITLTSPKTWVGTSGDGNWYTQENWSPAGVPQRANAVTINIVANVSVHQSSPAISFSSITLGQADGSAAVSLTLSTSIAAGVDILVHDGAGLTLDSTAVYELSGDLTMRPGSTMTHAASASAATRAAIRWDIGGEFDLQAGATITVSGRGHPGGAANGGSGFGSGGGTGIAPNDKGGGGGGYGGAGGQGENDGGAGGPSFGSQTDPNEVGSGGGGGGASTGSEGGAGGGLARIVAGTIIMDGLIEAVGADGASAALGGGGGGSGGAVSLSAADISGSGAFRAEGGSGQGGAGNEYGGGGGGGRIAVSASGTCSLAASTATVSGGFSAAGGAGDPSKPGQSGADGTVYTPNLVAPAGF